MISDSIFRKYDIRGQLNEQEISPENCRIIGRAFGKYCNSAGIKKIIVGSDNRPSSAKIRQAVIEGLCEAGNEAHGAATGADCNVWDAGLASSPLIYYATCALGFDAGINITGSHNPRNFNGMKICLSGAKPFFGQDIQMLKEAVKKEEEEGRRKEKENINWLTESQEQEPEEQESAEQESENKIRNKTHEIKAHGINCWRPYHEMLYAKFPDLSGLKVAVDAGNALGGMAICPVLEKAGCEVEKILCDLDGSFPVHIPDPTLAEGIELLRKKVLEKNLDIGIALDGDVDRVGVIDDKGDVIYGDYITLLLARRILSKNPGAKILLDIKASNVVFDEIKKLGGNPEFTPTGHSIIKDKMRKTGAVLAGEMSGHIFIADGYYGFDDAVYAALMLLQYVKSLKESKPDSKKLSHAMSELPKQISSPEIRINSPDEKKFGLIEKLKQMILKEYPDAVTIDGIRVNICNTGAGWGLARASNTEPKIILRFEAASAGELQQIKELFKEKLRQCGIEETELKF